MRHRYYFEISEIKIIWFPVVSRNTVQDPLHPAGKLVKRMWMVPGSTLYFRHPTSGARTESHGLLPSARKQHFTSSYSEISPIVSFCFLGGAGRAFVWNSFSSRFFSKSSCEQHFNSWNIHNYLSVAVILEGKFGWIENQLLMFSILEFLKYGTSWIFLQSTDFSIFSNSDLCFLSYAIALNIFFTLK